MGAKKEEKVSVSKARKNFWVLFKKNALAFLLNNALIYVSPHSERKMEKRVQIRSALLAEKGEQN